MKPINQCHVNLCHMTYPLMMSYLNNTVPAMGIQNGLARSNIRCLSFHSSTCYAWFPQPNSHFSLWSWTDGCVGGSSTTAIDEWRCRD